MRALCCFKGKWGNGCKPPVDVTGLPGSPVCFCPAASPIPLLACPCATGEAAAILARAEASAEGLRMLAEAISAQGGSEAVSLRVAEQYLSRWARGCAAVCVCFS